jgi:hypothetical protein
MFRQRNEASVATRTSESRRWDGRHLRALIDQATSDSQDESDEHTGLLGTIREEVACPFRARLGADEVECIRLEWPRSGYGLNAVCRCRGKTVVVDISHLDWIEPRPRGSEWIDAYFAWRDLNG